MVETALARENIQDEEWGFASASTVAHVMYQKYFNGMPLHRQEKDWVNQGIVLSRATLANWIIRSANETARLS